MNIANISGPELVQGSEVLTRKTALSRGITFHETTNQMSGERMEIWQAPLSGYSRSLMNAVDIQTSSNGWEMHNINGMFGPTPSSLYRMDSLQEAVAEDVPAVEAVLAGRLSESGLDAQGSFSLTREYGPNGEAIIRVDQDNPQWQEIEDLFKANPALSSDVQRVWNQQDTLAEMRVIKRTLEESAPDGGQESINKIWLDHGNADLASVMGQPDTLCYRDGRLLSPRMEQADLLLGKAS